MNIVLGFGGAVVAAVFSGMLFLGDEGAMRAAQATPVATLLGRTAFGFASSLPFFIGAILVSWIGGIGHGHGGLWKRGSPLWILLLLFLTSSLIGAAVFTFG